MAGDARDTPGTNDEIASKVRQTLKMIVNISPDTRLLNCSCGHQTWRKDNALQEGYIFYCLNPNCDHSYLVQRTEDEVDFILPAALFNCNIWEHQNIIPRRRFEKLLFRETTAFFAI